MIKEKFNSIKDWLEDVLRSLLGCISPDGRIVIILLMLLLFGAGSIYMTVSSIYNIGKKNGQQIEIEHIKHLELEQQTDSINLIKKYN